MVEALAATALAPPVIAVSGRACAREKQGRFAATPGAVIVSVVGRHLCVLSRGPAERVSSRRTTGSLDEVPDGYRAMNAREVLKFQIAF